MRTVTRSLLPLLAVVMVPIVLLALAPGPWPWKALSSSGYTALIAIFTAVMHRKTKKEKSRDDQLTSIWPVAVPAHAITTA